VSETRVRFISLTRDECERYVDTGEPLDKAGSYGIQGRGGVFVEKIDGDYYNVVGLPISRLRKLLSEHFGVELV
jgi:septum formation protein